MKHLLRTLLVLAPVALSAQNVVTSKHNLTNKIGNVDGQVCIFCHTPHQASGNTNGPLWNHTATTATYQMYTNTAGVTTTNAPGAASAACLSCHDGTVAIGSIINNGSRGATTITNATGLVSATDGRLDPSNVNFVGTDLRNDHPIAVNYTAGGAYKTFTAATNVKVFAGRVECASCHAVHDNTNAPFLRTTNSGSALCIECHTK